MASKVPLQFFSFLTNLDFCVIATWHLRLFIVFAKILKHKNYNSKQPFKAQIAGTSTEDHYKKKGKKEKMDASDTDSYASSSQESGRSTVVESFNPSTPPMTAVSYQTGPTKRRKGIPHRSPFGGLLLEV